MEYQSTNLTAVVGSRLHLNGKTVLDIGTRTGENAYAMKVLGADVYGVDPDAEGLHEAVVSGRLESDRALSGPLQDLANKFEGKFDLATCILWNISYAERESFTDAMCKVLKPGGKIVIGIHDDVYINDPYGAAVKPLMDRFCENVKAVNNAGAYNKYVLICAEPRNIPFEKTAAAQISSNASPKFRTFTFE